jgi:hypothetical protein
MLRLAILVSAVILLMGCATSNKSLPQDQGRVAISDELEGVYEFISEITTLTKPEKSISERTSSEWSGIWHFQHGYYSRVIMKKKGRSSLCYPQTSDSFGYESSAGTYQVRSNGVYLSEEFTICTLNTGRSEGWEYHFDGDNLVLTRTLHPYVEDIREGTITTVLRRLK